MGNSNKSSLTEFEADWQRKEEEKKREYDDQKLVELGHVLANLFPRDEPVDKQVIIKSEHANLLLKNDLILMSRFIEYVFDKRVRSILVTLQNNLSNYTHPTVAREVVKKYRYMFDNYPIEYMNYKNMEFIIKDVINKCPTCFV